MIKTFEEFILEYYERPLNEAFQSSKLREIIKQHGKPKYDFGQKMLYDLQDDEIIDVLNSKKEYWEKYSDDVKEDGQATFMLELEDGAVIVISNLDILKSRWRDMEDEIKNVFKSRHSERHKGNLGKYGGDDIHKKHMENVNKIEKRRLAEKLQEYTQEIVNAVENFMKNIEIEVDENGKCIYDEYSTPEIELTLDGEEYTIFVSYDCSTSDAVRRYGAEWFDIYYNLTSFEVFAEDGFTTATNDEIGITKETYKDLFKEYTIEDVEGYIYDEYALVGVKRSDFL